MRRSVPAPKPARRRGTLPAACAALLAGVGLALLSGCGAFDVNEQAGPLGARLGDEVFPGDRDPNADPSTGLSCITEKQGGPTSCKDEATWKSYGEMFCASKGLMVSKVTVSNSCGRGSFREATFECCKPTPPPPPPGMCFSATVGAAGTCSDDATLKRRAEETCKLKGTTLGKFAFGRACMGGHVDATFECCGGGTPPPPPPAMCTWDAVPGAGVCRTPDAWKMAATAFCASKKTTLRDLKFDKACGMGGFTSASAECCDNPAPPPPPPGPMCISEELRSTTGACLDDGTWKKNADDFCRSKMLSLKNLSFGAACMGGHISAKVECCASDVPPTPPPTMCFTQSSASMTCKGADIWKREGEAFCNSKGTVLKDVKLGTACMAGGYTSATFTCVDRKSVV